MAKGKGTPKVEPEPPTHGYNLRDRGELKAKKAAADAAKQASQSPAKKRSTSKANDPASRKKAKNDIVDADDTSPDLDYLPPGSSRNANPKGSSGTVSVTTPAHSYDLRDRKALEAKKKAKILPTLVRSSSSVSSLDGREYEANEREPEATLQDVKGIDDIHENLKNELIWPFSNVRNARIINLDIPRGVLLTGVPGTGKTALADAIVSEIRANGRPVRYYQETGACLSKYVGESEQNLRDLFQTAKDNAPSVIFLDEIDGLGRNRTEGHANAASHTILTTLLTELNTVPTGDVLVLAATNCPGLCDGALLRRGRFDLTIKLPLPNPAAREAILRHYFGRKSLKVESPVMAEILQQTNNTTGADLKALVAGIYQNVVRRVFEDGSWRGMTERELKEKRTKLHEIDLERDVRPKLRGITNASQNFGVLEE